MGGNPSAEKQQLQDLSRLKTLFAALRSQEEMGDKNEGSSPRSRSRSSSWSSRSSSFSSRSSGSGLSSRSSSPFSSRSSSAASSRSPSPEPEKLKVKIKPKGETPKKKASSPVKKKQQRQRQTASQRRKNDPEEEGEINSSSDEDFDDGLDDELIGDAEDRARLEKMTEKEREEELFKRAENRENLKKRFEIQKKLKKLNKKKKQQQQQEASDQDAEDGDLELDYSSMLDAKERSQDRRKTMDAAKFDKKSSALSELKARKQERERKQKERQDKQRSEQKEKPSRRSRSSSSSSSNSSSYRRRSSSNSSSSSSGGSSRSRRGGSSSGEDRGSDSDTERFQSSKSSKRVQLVETQMDLEPVRLSRFKLERFHTLPHFKRVAQGCFVRINIGNDNFGKPCYRCAEIIDVVETAKIYQMAKARTNLGLRLKLGAAERVFRMEYVSNSQFTLSEFEKWRQMCQEKSINLPTKDFVSNKKEDIDKALNYEYSSRDIDEILQKKERFNKNPVNYAMRKAKLMKEKEIAQADHDHEKANDIDKQLADLEQKAEELDKKRTENTRISSISLINNRNRKNNVLKAEQAIQEEMRRKEIEGVEANPFTRRKCNPRMVTKGGAAAGNDMATSELLKQLAEQQKQEKENLQKRKQVQSEREDQELSEEKPEAKKIKLNAPSTTLPPKEDLFDAHDFDIELDVDPQLSVTTSNDNASNSTGVGGVSRESASTLSSLTPKSVDGPSKRSLNLSDYKKRRGLI